MSQIKKQQIIIMLIFMLTRINILKLVLMQNISLLGDEMKSHIYQHFLTGIAFL